MKTCSKCLRVLERSEFHKRVASPDGLAYKCRRCVNQNSTAWRADNPNAYKEWHGRNQERKREYFKDWSSENKARIAENFARWMRANRGRVNATIAKRAAAKRRAVPVWFDPIAVREIYKKAERMRAETGLKYEVDHVVPLQGETVCGLHWHGNLQIIKKGENLSKSNRYWPGMP